MDSLKRTFDLKDLPNGTSETLVEGSTFDPTPVVDAVDGDLTGPVLDANGH